MATIDGEAVTTALAVRLGDASQRWTIEIHPGANTNEVAVVLRRDDGRELRRVVALEGETQDARARELAAAVSLAVEQDADEQAASPVPTAAPRSSPVPPQGWVATGGRVALGRPTDATGGASLRGGALWGRRHVQPLVAITTEHARPGTARIDGVTVGAGVAVGAPFGRWWAGGAAIPSYAWTRAVRRADDRASSFVSELAALVQFRHGGLLVALRAGVDVRAPAVRLVGGDADHRLGNLRFVAGLEVGATFGARNRRAGLDPSDCARSNRESRVGYTVMDREPSPRCRSRLRARRRAAR